MTNFLSAGRSETITGDAGAVGAAMGVPEKSSDLSPTPIAFTTLIRSAEYVTPLVNPEIMIGDVMSAGESAFHEVPPSKLN
jgi:hypothetical protein